MKKLIFFAQVKVMVEVAEGVDPQTAMDEFVSECPYTFPDTEICRVLDTEFIDISQDRFE